MSGGVEKTRRDALNHHDQMLDAQAGCAPCKLCGGKAIITDAGIGAGYYIQCGNSLSFRDHKGCMLDGRRSGGWAYNVMDWWNRLHSVTTPPARTYAEGVFAIGDRVEKIKGSSWCGIIVGTYSTSLTPEGYAVESEREPGSVQIYPVGAIRLLSQGEKG